MRELEPEYEGKVEVTIYTLSSAVGREEALKYDWQGKRHGLVGFDRHGKRAVFIPGHDYGKDRVREAFEETLR